MDGDAERLGSRALRDLAELALDLECVGRFRDDESVTCAHDALRREDLPRPVGDVLARHLDQPER